MHTWLNELIEVLDELGGEASLSEIYEQVRKRGIKKVVESSIRQTLEDYCPQKSFRRKKDVFYHRYNERSGKYGLRNKKEQIRDVQKGIEFPEINTPIASDINEPAEPERSLTKIYRILRDTRLARQIKFLHNNQCQICGHSVKLKNGDTYAEAHHVQPLGLPHNGPDVAGNILCVCPNHHAQLDYGAIKIEILTLRTHPKHNIDNKYIDYHNLRIYQ